NIHSSWLCNLKDTNIIPITVIQGSAQPGAPQTWWAAEEMVELDDPKLGQLQLRKWDNLHFSSSPEHPMTLILVERKALGSNCRQVKPLWLAWIGENSCSLEVVWIDYLRRFAIEHWYRLAKQTLHWTLPHLSTKRTM
ncbi:hypothetical protein QUB08_31695, partial [Microcoleus sp. BR0-C5]|uniref:hypothetical protein n=1 Tax=Microcoleus sp. BR0-C5 TaxID=2818713 RepID=UPI002FD2B4D6